MQIDVARAQADTLNEWASSWERDATELVGDGATEVAFLLQRAARMIARVVGDAPAQPEAAPAETIQEPTLETEPRADEG